MCDAPQCVLTPMQGNDKAFVWFVNDFSDGEAQVEKFAIRFRSVEDATEFKAKFEAA